MALMTLHSQVKCSLSIIVLKPFKTKYLYFVEKVSVLDFYVEKSKTEKRVS